MRKHGFLIAVIMFGLTWAGISRAEDQPIEQQLIDAMTKVFGVHPGFRTNHAKGIVVEGSFKASPEAAGLSSSGIVQRQPHPSDGAVFRCDWNTECAGRGRCRQFESCGGRA